MWLSYFRYFNFSSIICSMTHFIVCISLLKFSPCSLNRTIFFFQPLNIFVKVGLKVFSDNSSTSFISGSVGLFLVTALFSYWSSVIILFCIFSDVCYIWALWRIHWRDTWFCITLWVLLIFKRNSQQAVTLLAAHLELVRLAFTYCWSRPHLRLFIYQFTSHKANPGIIAWKHGVPMENPRHLSSHPNWPWLTV